MEAKAPCNQQTTGFVMGSCLHIDEFISHPITFLPFLDIHCTHSFEGEGEFRSQDAPTCELNPIYTTDNTGGEEVVRAITKKCHLQVREERSESLKGFENI